MRKEKIMENTLRHKILRSVNEISRAEWSDVFGDIPEGYDFFRTVEESGLEGFDFFYVLVYKGSLIRAIAPLFISDFNLDIAVEGRLQQLIQGIRRAFPRFLISKTLFCGSPFGENGILGIRKESADVEAVMLELLNGMRQVCAKNRISLAMFKDFTSDSSKLLDLVCREGFFMVESFPSVTNKLDFATLDDYQASLSHNTRKDLRRKLKKAQAAGTIEVKIVNNVEDCIDEVYKLYINTYNAGNVKFEKLTKEFFINVGRNLAGEARFFLYYLNGKLASFNLCFLHKDTLIDKFIGFDYDVAYKYNLYFFSWCYNVEWCLKNSVLYYQVGQTDYHPKLKLGGRLVPLLAYIKHSNPLINALLKMLAKALTPDNFDENIK